jgi:bidirectional [NiFe] hydrogenase diaphorase subunit
MSEIHLQIDGKAIETREGTTILQAAQSAGISIPTLCTQDKLEPYGACRICTVEAESRGRTQLVAACLYPVERDLVVRTRTDTVNKVRKMIVQLLLAHAPDSSVLQELAREYGANGACFEKEPAFCILCGVCVRYCAEVKKKNAISFVDRGTKRDISFIPEIASKECWDCKECFPLCPTSYLQAAYFLTQGLAFPSSSSEPASEK